MAVAENIRQRLIDAFGLNGDELDEALADEETQPKIDLSQPLPGQAADVLEIFLEAGEAVEDKDGLIWGPMIREGQFAVRPDAKGRKVRKALKVVAGHSDDARKQIGIQDLVDAFEDDAIEHVTVPSSHNNSVLENTGFIRKVKVIDAPIASGPNKGKKVPTLFGGYDFTEPDIKGKVKRGTIPNRSCGLLYDYVNTETGKTYKSVVEHVALTAKPWIRGMLSFGRKVALADGHEVEPLQLTDEEPEGWSDELDTTAEIDAPIEELLADGGAPTITWTHEDSPNWMRQQINDILSRARMEKIKSRRTTDAMVYESVPSYRCDEAKPEKALISDGWGDGSNHWVAGFKLNDGQVELDDFGKWQAAKRVFVSDDRDPPPKKDEPLSEPRQTEPPRPKTPRDRLDEAHQRRRQNLRADEPTSTPGGVVMAGTSEATTAELSDEARQRIEAAEERNRQLEDQLKRSGETVSRLNEESKRARKDKLLAKIRGLGFDEEHGQSGLLVEIEKIALADDQEPAVVSEAFSDDGSTEVTLSVTDVVERVFDAFKAGEDGKAALAEQVENNGDRDGEPPKDGTQAAEPVRPGEPTADGKPPATGSEGEELSTDPDKARERADKLAESNPELARLTGLGPSKTNGNQRGDSE